MLDMDKTKAIIAKSKKIKIMPWIEKECECVLEESDVMRWDYSNLQKRRKKPRHLLCYPESNQECKLLMHKIIL